MLDANRQSGIVESRIPILVEMSIGTPECSCLLAGLQAIRCRPGYRELEYLQRLRI